MVWVLLQRLSVLSTAMATTTTLCRSWTYIGNFNTELLYSIPKIWSMTRDIRYQSGWIYPMAQHTVWKHMPLLYA